VKSPVDSSLSLELANITDIDQNRGASLLFVKRLLRRDGVGFTFSLSATSDLTGVMDVILLAFF
jgi:hypothetical protein